MPDINVSLPLRWASLYLLLAIVLVGSSILLAMSFPLIVPLLLVPIMGGGLLFVHGIAPFADRAFKLLVKAVGKTLDMVFD